ncbi:MAG: hypothetical protein JWN13_1087 [Betaproteobacteria bacterium]|jgi:hypothetical protein|nr:hypothetical protein [Betaproteobacteria bacterium]
MLPFRKALIVLAAVTWERRFQAPYSVTNVTELA